MIPKRTYARLNHGPVVTVGVDVVLVAREDLDDEQVYALTRELIERRRQLAEVSPSLFEGLRGEVDTSRLTFPLHEGARQYYERDAPGFAERYAELGGVIFSVLVASFTGLVGFVQWRSRRRKDRIDVYYAEVWKVRARVDELEEEDRERAVDELRALEARAFEALMAEELAADEAFRILVTLINDTVRDLRG